MLFFEKGLMKVTSSHMHSKCGNMLHGNGAR